MMGQFWNLVHMDNFMLPSGKLCWYKNIFKILLMSVFVIARTLVLGIYFYISETLTKNMNWERKNILLASFWVKEMQDPIFIQLWCTKTKNCIITGLQTSGGFFREHRGRTLVKNRLIKAVEFTGLKFPMELCKSNPFSTNVPLLYLMETSENRRFSRGIEMEHWLKMG